jgi:SAM-dependent methyltransferase
LVPSFPFASQSFSKKAFSIECGSRPVSQQRVLALTAHYFKTYRSLLKEVRAFNERQIVEHETTPRGVGWNSAEAQEIRFEQLLKVIRVGKSVMISLNDVGCGYGALLPYIVHKDLKLDYRGFDLSGHALRLARTLHKDRYDFPITFSTMDKIYPATYSIASGLFAMRLGFNNAIWLKYVSDTLDIINDNSISGFAFNMLTMYSDCAKMRSELYYADPRDIFHLCKTRYSRNVALLHDYSLYDFTIIVRKDGLGETAT